MSAVQLKVDTQTLKSTADRLSAQTKKIRTNFTEIQKIMAETGGYWYGDASDADRGQFSKFKETMDSLVVRLDAQPEKLLEIAGVIESAETQNTEMIQELSKEDFI